MRTKTIWLLLPVLALTTACAGMQRQKKQRAEAERMIQSAEGVLEWARKAGAAVHAPDLLSDAESELAGARAKIKGRRYEEAIRLARSSNEVGVKAASQAEKALEMERAAKESAGKPKSASKKASKKSL